MIWLRWAGAVVLGVHLTAVLLVALMLLSLRGTFLNADFYTDQLEKADVYRFVMEDVLTSVLDDVREREPGELGADLRENPVAESGVSTARIVAAVHRALSPEDLEALVAPAVREFAGYVTGESDAFEIDLRIGETIRGVVAELQVLMREAGVYDRLIERELEPRIREAAGDTLASDADASGWMQRLFGSDEEAGGRLAEVIIGVVTPEWFGAQVEHVLDELTSYLTGESDSFEIRIRLSDAQVATAVEDLKSILREADASELVYTDVLDPAVDKGLDEAVTLPYGVEISRDEVKDVLREAAPRAWVQQQADLLIEDVSAYVTGRSEGFSTGISLVGNKQDCREAPDGPGRQESRRDRAGSACLLHRSRGERRCWRRERHAAGLSAPGSLGGRRSGRGTYRHLRRDSAAGAGARPGHGHVHPRRLAAGRAGGRRSGRPRRSRRQPRAVRRRLELQRG